MKQSLQRLEEILTGDALDFFATMNGRIEAEVERYQNKKSKREKKLKRIFIFQSAMLTPIEREIITLLLEFKYVGSMFTIGNYTVFIMRKRVNETKRADQYIRAIDICKSHTV